MPENAGNPNILLVDNDRIVIEALADLFKRILPAVNIADSATSGVEALKLLTSTNTLLHCLICRWKACKARKSAVACGWQTAPRRFSV